MQKYEYYIDTEKEKLHGWQFNNPDIAHSNIIYFGGNAEDVIYNIADASRYSASKLFFTNLPGYGNSTGTPSEKSFYDNALQAYDTIVQKHQLDPDDIIIMGRSLGASVAAYVAAQRKVKSLILVTPFDSVANIAAQQFSWFPVRRLLRHKFNTMEYVSQINAPILIVAAEHDEIIPKTNGNNLYQARPENISLLEVKNTGHNNISQNPQYFQYINGFILANTALAE
ncbi:MAG: alpha/beta hydrolase [Gammaproteobacteria bacterium]|nr:alpha/beta hydrolase [Gammaproteobacteria bacterium]